MIDGHVNILNIPIFSGDKPKVLDLIWQRLEAMEAGNTEKPMVVFTPNPEQLMLAKKEPEFAKALKQATINVADAVGLVWADWYLARSQQRRWKIKQRVPGIEVAHELVLRALQSGKKVFLLGGAPAIAKKAADSFTLQAAGDEHYLEWDGGAKEIRKETIEERDRVLKKMAMFRPDLLLVAYGAPSQERWVIANKNAIAAAGVKVAMVVGGSFDVWANKVPRAPLIMRQIGLEWLGRLFYEPWRWRRQLKLAEFVTTILRSG